MERRAAFRVIASPHTGKLESADRISLAKQQESPYRWQDSARSDLTIDVRRWRLGSRIQRRHRSAGQETELIPHFGVIPVPLKEPSAPELEPVLGRTML